LTRTISRGIFNIEKLKKIETEEAARFNQIKSSTFEKQQIYLPSNIAKSFKIDWLFFSDFVFDPGLLTDFEIFENVETPSNTQSSF